MRASDVISSLQQRGIVLKVIDGRLKIGGAEKLTEREKAALRAHKASILIALEPPPIPTTPAGSQLVAPSTAATEPLPNQTEPAAANRQSMPHIASMIDAFRSTFNANQVKVVFAEENGVRLGRQKGYEERAAVMQHDGNMTMQEAEQKAGTCYYCRHWQGTKSGKDGCCSSFAPPVPRQAGDTCDQFVEGRP